MSGRLLLAVPVLMALAVPLATPTAARADFEAGMAAYARGDTRTALQEWIEEANRGNARALWLVGNMYLSGEGVADPEPRIAAEYYRQAADQGFAEAQVSLAMLYCEGRGVERDLEQALAWLYQAAAQRHPIAQVDLGDLFLEGLAGHVAPDPAQAAQWFQQAAAQRIVLAQFKLAQLYLEGVGADRDPTRGYAWLLRAVAAAESDTQSNWSQRVMPLDRVVARDIQRRTLRQIILDTQKTYRRALTPSLVREAETLAKELP